MHHPVKDDNRNQNGQYREEEKEGGYVSMLRQRHHSRSQLCDQDSHISVPEVQIASQFLSEGIGSSPGAH
jgi:hypothetical protein